ncbi:hypothetical protein M2352_000253 [Azospirillum fermentarium]|uniref:hypothetical protein n=1 Tax=Azospirillum fermentarium TaxID=1233114 RepID=UPI0022275CE4|nr:hypothetical protein [Azospirillum fermentarium]MCW2244662.1 hypothetical protein [Azospirillum fermentarium]
MYDLMRCTLWKMLFENNYFQILLMFYRQRHAALCKRIAQQIDNVIASQTTLAAHAFTGMTGPREWQARR